MAVGVFWVGEGFVIFELISFGRRKSKRNIIVEVRVGGEA